MVEPVSDDLIASRRRDARRDRPPVRPRHRVVAGQRSDEGAPAARDGPGDAGRRPPRFDGRRTMCRCHGDRRRGMGVRRAGCGRGRRPRRRSTSASPRSSATCCARTPTRDRAAARARRPCRRAASTSRWTSSPPRSRSRTRAPRDPRSGCGPADLGLGAIPIAAGLAVAGWLVVVAVTQVPGAWRAWAPPPGALDHDTRARRARRRGGRAGDRRHRPGPSEPVARHGRGATMSAVARARDARDAPARDHACSPVAAGRGGRERDVGGAAPLLDASGRGRLAGAPDVLVVSTRQPVLRRRTRRSAAAPGREQLRVPAEDVRRRLVAVQLRRVEPVRHHEQALLPGLLDEPRHAVPGRVPLRRPEVLELQDLLRGVPLRELQHATSRTSRRSSAGW